MPSSRKRALALLAAGAVTGATVLGSAAASDRGRAAASPSPPRVVRGLLITPTNGTPAIGSPVSKKALGIRTFVGNKVGVALAAATQSQSAAITTNGGKKWRIVSPALHLDAAQAPLVVTFIGAANKHTFYAYGGGQVVDATGDGGKHWYRANLGALAVAVVPGFNGQLIAFSQDEPNGSTTVVTSQYVSNDGGQTWTYDTHLGGN
jgi:hypothetical protein